MTSLIVPVKILSGFRTKSCFQMFGFHRFDVLFPEQVRPFSSATSGASAVQNVRIGLFKKVEKSNYQSIEHPTGADGESRPWRASRKDPSSSNMLVKSSQAKKPRNVERNTVTKHNLLI